MTKMTDAATKAYDEYISRAKTYLKAAGTDNADEVIADLREHIDSEIAEQEKPVSEAVMEDILSRLGSPQDLVNMEDVPWWRKALLQFRTGPEDWRLAYATAGLLLLGVLFGWLFAEKVTSSSAGCPNIQYVQQAWPEYVMTPDHPGYEAAKASRARVMANARTTTKYDFNVLAFATFFVFSFVLARATINYSCGKPLQPAQKWLVYPSLWGVYAPLAIAIPFGITVGMGALGFVWSAMHLKSIKDKAIINYNIFDINMVGSDAFDFRVGTFATWSGAVGLAITLLIFALIARSRNAQRIGALIFLPFFKSVSPKWSKWMFIGSAILAVVCIATFKHAHEIGFTNWHF